MLVFALNREFAFPQLLGQLLDFGVQILHLPLEHLNLLPVLGLQLVDLVLSVHLLEAPGFFNSPFELLLHFLTHFLLVLFCLRSESVLAIEFLLKKFVVFSVVLLYVGRNLFGVLLFERFDGFVVVFEFEQLLFIVFAPCIKSLFYIQEVLLHVLGFVSVFFVQVSLFFGHGLLEHFELALRLLPLLQVGLLQLLYLVLVVRVVLRLFDFSLLPENDLVCLFQNGLHFFFVGVGERGLVLRVLLVLRVQVEDDLGELGDLLGHLVVGLLGGPCSIV